MKRISKYSILFSAAMLAVASLTGCQRDELAGEAGNGSDILSFSVGFAGSGELTATKGATLTSDDGTVSIPVSCSVTDGIEVDLPGARKSASATRGTQINSESEFLGEGLTSFTAAGWNGDKTEFVPSSPATVVSYSDGKWKTDATYKWRGSDSKTFLAYANLPSSGATVANSVDPAVKQTFTYTVPTDARQQNDIMLGWYEGNGGGTATAAITMVHPLTAVVFKKGEINADAIAIKSISISGIYESGTADVTYSLSGSTVVPSYTWSSRTGSQTVTLNPAEDATELEVSADNVIGEPFIVLPQNVTASTLKLTVTVVKDGEESVLAAFIPAGTWQEGKTNTYTIGYLGQYIDLGLSVKWGNFNLGASSPEEYGEYYQWAGLDNVASTSINLDFSHCPYHTGSDEYTGWTKYNSLSGHGTIDNKTILDLDDDVAHVKKQGPWHMPTEAQWDELLNNCTQEWVDDFNGTGVAGMKLTSKIAGYTDRYIFLPAAGYRTGNTLKDVGTICNYWYPQMKADNTFGAYYIYITKDKIKNYDNNRYTGRTVRPVYDDTPKTITAIPASGCEAMGTVSGSGSYLFGKTATLSATPADGYVFSKWNDGVTTATRTITVTAAATYEAIFETNPVLPGKFSVSATEYAQFSRGNLYCTDNGTSASPRYTFNFERNQYDFRHRPGKGSMLNGVFSTSSGTPANTSGSFQWNVSAAVPGQDYGAFGTTYPGTPADDAMIDWGQAIGGNWYTMTKEEMSYLVGYGTLQRPNYENLRKVSKIDFSGFSVNGFVLAPDNYDFTSHPLRSSYSESEWGQAEQDYGLVFLPCAGFNYDAWAVGVTGRYYVSNHPGSHLYFGDNGENYIGGSDEYHCMSMRLVKKFDKPVKMPE